MRNSSVELLRFLMMLMLCFWHILMHGYGLKGMDAGTAMPSYNQLALLALLAFPVDCFIFISGFYGIKLKWEKVIRLFLQASFFYLLCVILRNILHLGSPLASGIILVNFLPIANWAWWFLAWYMMLMLLSPIIEQGIRSISQRQFTMILVGIVVLNCFGTWLNRLHSGSDFVGLLTIYLIGRYMSQRKPEISKIKAGLFLFASTITLLLLLLVTQYTGKIYFTWTLLSFCSPLVVVQAIAVFYLVKGINLRYTRMFNFLGAHCFAIYLITEFSGNLFYDWWRKIYECHGLCVMAIAVLSASLCFCLLDLTQSMMLRPLNNYLMRKSNK